MRKTNLSVRRLPVCMALGALVGGVQGTFHLMGNRLDSFYHEEDEFERKEKIRRTTRTPVEQTISEVGEGRGAHTFFTLQLNHTDISQASEPPVTRREDEIASRRRTDSKLTPSAPLSTAANRRLYQFLSPLFRAFFVLAMALYINPGC